MKAKKLYGYAFMTIFALATCASSCSGDDNEPEKKPVVTEPTAEVSFVVNDGNGGSSGSASTVVQKGDTLNMTISQKSSYTDSDGKVYTCEPKATIRMHAQKDTLHVKDLTTLTSVKQSAEPRTNTSGSNPTLTSIIQTFDVGGQEIMFDLGYEIYRFTSAANKTIEMPYIKLNPAKYGAVQTSDNTRAAATVTGIRLTPILPQGQTRGIILRDSTMFDVSVSFNLEAESKNTSKDSTTPLSFEIEFVAVVENVTELPDATMDYSYQLNILSGTTSKASPFELKKGEELFLEWAQNSRYTYFSAMELNGKTFNQEPKATVKLSVAQDTLKVTTLEGLEKVTEQPSVETTEGDEPLKHIIKQSFVIGGQVIPFETIYETCADLIIEGEKVLIPHLKLSKVEVASVSTTELKNTSPSNNGDKVYETTVVFKQHLSGENTPETVSEDIEYIVKYTVILENKLISTVYEKDYEWVEAHYNIPLTSYYVVRRIRTYSSGEKLTDTFTSPHGRMVEHGVSTDVAGTGHPNVNHEYQLNDSVRFVYHNIRSDEKNDDYVKIFYWKTGVPNLNLLSWEVREDFDGWSIYSLNDYKDARTYTYKYNPENPKEDWYVCGYQRNRTIRLNYNFSSADYEMVRRYDLSYRWYDRFLYLDGQLFDFSDYKMTYDFDLREEATTLSDGAPAKVFTYDCKGHYLGREFYIATVDTLYQLPK